VAGAAILAPILYYASTVDVRPPQVDHFGVTQHLPGDSSVALTTASLEVVFSEMVDHASAEGAFVIDPAVPGAFSWSGTTMVFTPARRLPLQTAFRVSFHAGVKDETGNAMGAGGPFGFRTVGSPSVVASRPADGAEGVALDATISITFSTLMDTASVERALEVIPRIDLELRWSGEQLTIVPRTSLHADQHYLVIVGSGATDLAGTALGDPLRLAFTTVNAGLRPRTLVPADGSQGIAVTTPIAVIMDRALDPDSLDDRLMTISPNVAGSLTIVAPDGAAGLADSARRVLRFTPSGPLPANTTFTVTLSASVLGADGARLDAPLTWTFTTGSASQSLGNQIVYLSSRSGVANLWAMNPDGTNQHELSSELSPVTSYAVAPDGQSYVVGDGVRLVESDADGSGRRVLTESGMVEFDPAYAPDGSAIVFGRADAATGAGLGLWSRGPGGGTAEQIDVPAGAGGATLSPSPSGDASASPGTAAPAALLRAPRYSPDGKRLAFVDAGGRVGILDLGSGFLTGGAFHAASPPAWFPDGSGILVSGVRAPSGRGGWTDGRLTPGTAVPPMTPTGLRLTAADRAALRIVELDAGLSLVQPTPLKEGAGLPAIGPNGRIAYLVLDPDGTAAGSLWIAASGGIGSRELRPDSRARFLGVAFAPEPGTLVVARQPVVASPPSAPSPSPGASASVTPLPLASGAQSPAPAASNGPGSDEVPAAGIWLIDASTGIGQQLTTDGWLPRWIP